ncbi:MAG: hypothetical protein ABI216_01890 [Devosia sp.]
MASKYLDRVEGLGSTLYRLTWKAATTQSGREIFVQRASVLHTHGPGSISSRRGWGTPRVSMINEGPATHDRAQHAARRTKKSESRIEEQSHMADQIRIVAADGRIQISSHAEMAGGARLNPAHPRWLLGIPSVVLSCAPLETPSAYRKRLRSSELSSIQRRARLMATQKAKDEAELTTNTPHEA